VYRIVEGVGMDSVAARTDVEFEVNSLLLQGWKLAGNLIIEKHASLDSMTTWYLYSQPMIQEKQDA